MECAVLRRLEGRYVRCNSLVRCQLFVVCQLFVMATCYLGKLNTTENSKLTLTNSGFTFSELGIIVYCFVPPV